MLKIFSRFVALKTLLLLVTEVLWITVVMTSLADLYYRYIKHWEEGVDLPHIALRVAVITLICQLCLYYNDLYDLAVVNSRQELIIRLMQSFGVACLLMFPLFIVFPQLVIGSSNVVAVAVMAGVLILLGWRMLITLAYRVYEVPKRLLLLGTSDLAFDILTALEARSELSMRVIGLILGSEAAPETIPVALPVLGTVDDLERIAAEHQINRVVVALPD